jgi:hypothetical protein
VPEPLNVRGFARRPLGGVDAVQVVREVEGVRALWRQRVELMRARDDTHGYATGIHQIDRQPADRLG